MDPLAAYRTSVAPWLTPGGAMPASPEETIAKIIPKSELDQLSSSVLTPAPATSVLPGSGAGASGPSSQSFFGDFVKEVSAKQAEASAAMREVMTGGDVPLHQAMLKAQEASISFQLMVQVRNKLLEAYQELMRMQV